MDSLICSSYGREAVSKEFVSEAISPEAAASKSAVAFSSSFKILLLPRLFLPLAVKLNSVVSWMWKRTEEENHYEKVFLDSHNGPGLFFDHGLGRSILRTTFIFD